MRVSRPTCTCLAWRSISSKTQKATNPYPVGEPTLSGGRDKEEGLLRLRARVLGTHLSGSNFRPASATLGPERKSARLRRTRTRRGRNFRPQAMTCSVGRQINAPAGAAPRVATRSPPHRRGLLGTPGSALSHAHAWDYDPAPIPGTVRQAERANTFNTCDPLGGMLFSVPRRLPEKISSRGRSEEFRALSRHGVRQRLLDGIGRRSPVSVQ